MPDLTKIGKYEVLEKIGEGGFAVVYKGRDPFIKRPVAIKTCSAEDQSLRTRFFREAEIAGQLQHPNIVTVFDFGMEGPVPFLVQEYLSGEDLDKVIKRRAHLTESDKIEILLQVARGLEYAHSMGVIHRDIKPGNIRVLEGPVPRAKIMDFGIAKLTSAEVQLTGRGMTMGTAGYLAPEQLRGGDIDGRSDIFSFGVVAYELFTSVRPFLASNFSALVDEILHKEPIAVERLWPECPPALAALIGRCLRKSAAERHATMAAVIPELEAIQRDLRSQERETAEARTFILQREPVAAAADLEPKEGGWTPGKPQPEAAPTPAESRPAPAPPVAPPMSPALPAVATPAAAADGDDAHEARTRMLSSVPVPMPVPMPIPWPPPEGVSPDETQPVSRAALGLPPQASRAPQPPAAPAPAMPRPHPDPVPTSSASTAAKPPATTPVPAVVASPAVAPTATARPAAPAPAASSVAARPQPPPALSPVQPALQAPPAPPSPPVASRPAAPQVAATPIAPAKPRPVDESEASEGDGPTVLLSPAELTAAVAAALERESQPAAKPVAAAPPPAPPAVAAPLAAATRGPLPSSANLPALPATPPVAAPLPQSPVPSASVPPAASGRTAIEAAPTRQLTVDAEKISRLVSEGKLETALEQLEDTISRQRATTGAILPAPPPTPPPAPTPTPAPPPARAPAASTPPATPPPPPVSPPAAGPVAASPTAPRPVAPAPPPTAVPTAAKPPAPPASPPATATARTASPAAQGGSALGGIDLPPLVPATPPSPSAPAPGAPAGAAPAAGKLAVGGARAGGKRGLLIAGSVAVLLVLAVGAYLAFLSGQPVPTPQPAAPAAPPPAPAPPPDESSLVVEAVPWGQIVHVIDASGRELPLPSNAFTPLALTLPPGHYTVSLAHPDALTNRTCSIDLVAGGAGVCRVEFSAIDVNQFLQDSGWWR